jgi:hypothetical protein
MNWEPILGSGFLGLICLGGAIWFYKLAQSQQKHRFDMRQLEIQRETGGGGNSAQLQARCEALEKRCAALEEQMKTAHLLLADEQRALDQKLANILPQETPEKRDDGPSRQRV